MGKKTGVVYKRVVVPLSKEQLLGVFRTYDKDGDGKLSMDELKAAFDYLGSRWSHFRAGFALFHADSNRDGFISEGELEKLIDYTFSCNYSLN